MIPKKHKACATKRGHSSHGYALAHKRRLVEGGAPEFLLRVYRCRYCRLWHVGHPTGSRTRQHRAVRRR